MVNDANAKMPAENPLVRDLLGVPGGALVVGGYAGPGREGFVRLYSDLGLSTYVEIPADDVVRVIEDKDTPEKPSVVFFRSTAELTYTQTMSVRGQRLADTVADMAGGASSCGCGGACGGGAGGTSTARQGQSGGGIPDICEWACQERFHLCVARSERVWQNIWCALAFLGCRIDCNGPVIV